MGLAKNSSLQAVKTALQDRNVILTEFSGMFIPSDFSWKKLQIAVRAGHAGQYPVGMELPCSYYGSTWNTTYDFPWIVMDNNRVCTWQDGTTHPGLWLMAKYLTHEWMNFDMGEGVETSDTVAEAGYYYCGLTGTTYTKLDLSAGDAVPHGSYDTILKGIVNKTQFFNDGYNFYRESALRKWLNTSEPAGEWWESTHYGDNKPSMGDVYPGFMRGLDSDFLAVVQPVKVQTARNTSVDGGVTDITYDRFFPPSVEEMYGVPQIANVEGPYFPYWKMITNLSSPSNDANEGRKIARCDDHTIFTGTPHLRSCSKNTAYQEWQLNCSTGAMTSSGTCDHSRNVLVACVVS